MSHVSFIYIYMQTENENANRPKLDRLIKDEMVIFHTEGLKIAINTNLITVDFLDVTFDLFTG